jgi:hypothetical protein
MLLLSWLVTRPTYRTRGERVSLVRHEHPSQLSLVPIYRQVTVEEATNKATQMNIMFMETSAKAGHNVKGLFKKIAMSLPGMEKESTSEANTSGSSKPSILLFLLIDWLYRDRCHNTSGCGSARCLQLQLLIDPCIALY